MLKVDRFSLVMEVAIIQEATEKKKFHSCQYCGRKNHPHFKCWRNPDMRCQKYQKLGLVEIICKEKKQKQQGETQVANQHV